MRNREKQRSEHVSMVLPLNPRLFLLDANACNSRQRIDELTELERLGREGVIELQYTESTWDEARRGSEQRDEKVANFIFTGLPADSAHEGPWCEAITRVLFPDGSLNENRKRDVEALLTAKMSGGVFVTRDGASKSQPRGILGSKAELATLGIEVVSFTEALRIANADAQLGAGPD
jgi:hypothetical protein